MQLAARFPPRTLLSAGGAVAALSVAALLPVVTGPSYAIRIGFLTLLYVTASLAWNLVGGVAGQVSFGFAAFYGMGAFSAAIGLINGLPFFVALLIGAAIALVFSVLIGLPTFRLRGPYFAIATIGVNEAVRVLMLNWESLTGGASGLNIPLTNAPEQIPQYYQGLVLAAAALAVSWRLMSSRFGLGLLAVKEDEDAALSLGVNALRSKLIVHAVAAIMVAAAGAMYARFVFFVHPNGVFAFSLSISFLLMPVIGGLGTLWGPVVGAVLLVFVQEQISVRYPDLHLYLYGALLVLIVIFEPGGLAGIVRRLLALKRRLPRVAQPAASTTATADPRGR